MVGRRRKSTLVYTARFHDIAPDARIVCVYGLHYEARSAENYREETHGEKNAPLRVHIDRRVRVRS
jgi:hypothetical protein